MGMQTARLKHAKSQTQALQRASVYVVLPTRPMYISQQCEGNGLTTEAGNNLHHETHATPPELHERIHQGYTSTS